jgi:general stress protein YciG
MAGTKNGGIQAAKTNIERHGEDFYKKIGSIGGKKSHPETRIFKLRKELAVEAGRKGGLISRRRKNDPRSIH